MRKAILLILTGAMLFGCLPSKSIVSVDFKKNKNASQSSSIHSASVSSVQIINHQLVINGSGFTDVTNVKVDGNSLNENFSIESKTATKIIANSVRAFSFDVSKVFSLILSDANASATFAIDFSLCNATLNGKGFDCAAPIADKDVLSYDSASGKWKPRAVSGLNYLGTFNASTNPATGPATQPAGSYYIISASGSIAAIPFTTGDWLVSNGSSWQKIDNSTAVLSVFGRSGTITAQQGDYSLNLMGDVSFPVAPVAGKVLKYDGTNWVAGDDLSGGGAGSVSTTEIADGAITDVKITSVATSKLTGTISSAQIADGSIVNADINAAAAIDYSKLNVPNGAIAYAKLNIADGDIPAAKISGLPILSSILAATITDGDTTHAPTGEAVYEALQLKLGTTGGTLSVGTINGVPTPVAPSDIVNKAYTDSADALRLLKAGDTMTGVLTLDNDLKVKGGANYVTVKGSGSTANYNFTLPANGGTNGYVLATDGNGVTSWVDVGFSESNVLGTDLAGLNTGVNGPITATDTVLGAFGKMQYQVTDLKSKGLWDKAVNDISYSAGNVSIDKKLRLKSDNANYVEMLSPNSLGATYTLTLPANDGNANQVLKTDGAGVLAWVDVNDATVQSFAKSVLPTCGAGEVLKSNGSTFSCVTDNAGAGAFSGTADRAVLTTAGGALGVSATTSTELGYVSGVTSAIQTQINNKQAADPTLTSLAAYNTNGILVQTAADTFTGRTITGTANRVSVTNGSGVGGNPTLDIPTALLPSPVAGDVGKFLKATAADTSVWTALGSSDVTTALGFTPINKAGDTISSGTFTFSGAAALRAPDPVAATDVVNKQYLETFGQWTKSGSDIYRSSGKVGVGTTTPTHTITAVNTAGSSIRVGKTATNEGGFLTSSGSDNFVLSAAADWDGTNFVARGGSSSQIYMNSGNIALKADSVVTSGSTFTPTTRLYIQASSGNVGIGTTSPTSALTVGSTAVANNQLLVQSLSPGIPSLLLQNSFNSLWMGLNSSGADSNGIPTNNAGISVGNIGLVFATGSTRTERMRITSAGNVGIGTTSPSTALEIKPAATTGGTSMVTVTNPVLNLNKAAAGDSSAIRFSNNGTVVWALGDQYGSSFNLWNAANSSYNLTVLSNGNVGIGATSPQSKLDVGGSVRLGTDATACSGTISGAMRFSTPNIEYCNGTAWVPFAAAGTGTITGTHIVDGAIMNADVNASAAIAQSKIANLTTDLAAKQGLDATLTSLAAHNTNGILVQTAADTFVGRSIAGTANRVTVTNGDGVAGNPTVNIPTALLPSPVAGDVGKFLKATAADTSVWTALGLSDVTTALGFTPINKAGDTLTTGTFTLSGAAVLRTPDPIGLTDVANKQYVDGVAGLWLPNTTNIYRASGNVGIGISTPGIVAGGGRYLTLSNAAGNTSIELSGQGNSSNAEFSRIDFHNNNTGNINNSARVSSYTGANLNHGALVFSTNGGSLSERMRIDSSGNVGVGTTTPGADLEVRRIGTWSDLRLASDQGSIIELNSGTYSATDGRIIYGSTKSMTFTTDYAGSTSPDLSILAGGNVGVGVSSPVAKLHVNGAAIIGNSNSTFTDASNYIFGASNSITNSGGGNASGMTIIGSSNSLTTSNINFGYNSSIVGNSNTLTNAGSSHVFGWSNSLSGAISYVFGTGNTSTAVQANIVGSSITNNVSNSLMIGQNNTSKITILGSNGNVGIGTTAPSTRLNVSSTAGDVAKIESSNVNYTNLQLFNTSNSKGWNLLTVGSTPTAYGNSGAFTIDEAGGGSRMTIAAGGNVGIGTTTPTQKLQVLGGNIEISSNTIMSGGGNSGGLRMYNTNSANSDYLNIGWVAEDVFAFQAADVMTHKHIALSPYGGFVGIGTLSPDEKFVVSNGTTTGKYTTGGWTHSSDVRLKHDISPIEDALNKILKIKGVEYKFNSDPENKNQLGFIAQEVEPIFPEVVQTDSKGFKSMIYSNLIAPLVESIKALYARLIGVEKKIMAQDRQIASKVDKTVLDEKVRNLSNENEKLMKKNAELEARLERIETLLNKIQFKSVP